MVNVRARIKDGDIEAIKVMILPESETVWVEFAGLDIIFNSREQAYEFAAGFLKKIQETE
jgi:hypothetical protein